ncbi:ataxin-2 [Anaeramoeba flamelloides]|uniref:Ataxin-2 n=1 Tax=Anaeramoeba flamelloides TaxID=1746091 RepID=A0AAV8A9W8_9EUKA|nr:ataxin-2 [Anaeramoeba flamelloides]
MTNSSRKESSQRLNFLFSNLVGYFVNVKTNDGSEYEGILSSLNLKSKNFQLARSRLIAHPELLQNDICPLPNKGLFKISLKNLLSLKAMSVNFDLKKTKTNRNKNSKFAIDSGISSGQLGQERELEMWKPEQSLEESKLSNPSTLEWDLGYSSEEEGQGKEHNKRNQKQTKTYNKHWNQFETNKQLFGVNSEYNEEEYTSKLSVNSKKRQKANKLAQEIQTENKKNTNNLKKKTLTEEELFSSVVRPNQVEGNEKERETKNRTTRKEERDHNRKNKKKTNESTNSKKKNTKTHQKKPKVRTKSKFSKSPNSNHDNDRTNSNQPNDKINKIKKKNRESPNSTKYSRNRNQTTFEKSSSSENQRYESNSRYNRNHKNRDKFNHNYDNNNKSHNNNFEKTNFSKPYNKVLFKKETIEKNERLHFKKTKNSQNREKGNREDNYQTNPIKNKRFFGKSKSQIEKENYVKKQQMFVRDLKHSGKKSITNSLSKKNTNNNQKHNSNSNNTNNTNNNSSRSSNNNNNNNHNEHINTHNNVRGRNKNYHNQNGRNQKMDNRRKKNAISPITKNHDNTKYHLSNKFQSNNENYNQKNHYNSRSKNLNHGNRNLDSSLQKIGNMKKNKKKIETLRKKLLTITNINDYFCTLMETIVLKNPKKTSMYWPEPDYTNQYQSQYDMNYHQNPQQDHFYLNNQDMGIQMNYIQQQQQQQMHQSQQQQQQQQPQQSEMGIQQRQPMYGYQMQAQQQIPMEMGMEMMPMDSQMYYNHVNPMQYPMQYQQMPTLHQQQNYNFQQYNQYEEYMDPNPMIMNEMMDGYPPQGMGYQNYTSNGPNNNYHSGIGMN